MFSRTSTKIILLTACLILAKKAYLVQAKTISPLLIRGSGSYLVDGEYNIIKNYDVVMLKRYHYLLNSTEYGNTWQTLKHYNPDIQIYLYDMVMQTASNQDSYSPGAAYLLRYYGDMNVNHPDYFLYHGNEKVYDTNYSNPPSSYYYFLDIGNQGLWTYAAKNIKDDIISQPWVADGVFFDGPGPNLPSGKSAAFDLYPSNASWQPKACGYINSLSNSLRAGNPSQKTMINFGFSSYPDGAPGWIYLDNLPTPPDFIFEEGAFAVEWGSADVWFFGETDWKRQIDTMSAVVHSGTAWNSHTKLVEGGSSGADNYGKSVTFNDALWYSLSSYLLGRPVASGKALFAFNQPHPAVWHDEFNIDIGEPVGNYQISKIGTANIYWREYEKGYVYVNPTNINVSDLTLYEQGKQLSHENLNIDPRSISDTNSISLDSHRGAIVLKSNLFSSKPADLNQDNSIDTGDLDILKTDFLKLTANLSNPRSDINLDGQCAIKDLGILMSNWGK